MVSNQCSIRQHAKFEPDHTDRTGVMAKIIGALEEEVRKKEFRHPFLPRLKKSQLSNRKKKLTSGFHQRNEEGEIFSEKNKSDL